MHPTGNLDAAFSRSAAQTLSRSHCRNIKQKISQWEGWTKDEERQKPKDFGVKYGHDWKMPPAGLGHGHKVEGVANIKSLGLDFRENSRLCSVIEEEERIQEVESPIAKPFTEGEDDERWQGERLPPGNFYTSRDLWKQIEALPPDKLLAVALDLKRKRESCNSAEKELNVAPAKSIENLYCDVESQDGLPGINPIPKPRRTFRYQSERDPAGYPNGGHIERKPWGNGGCPATFSHDPEQRVASRGIRGRSKRCVSVCSFLFLL